MIRYFTNGRAIEKGQEFLIEDNWVEIKSPVREDGTIYPKHKNIELLEKKEDGTYATYYNTDGTIDTAKEDEKSQILNIQNIKDNCTANNPVTLNVTDINNTELQVTFNGGDSSASAISGAITLAQSLGETSVGIWDIDNKITYYSFDMALLISKTIAKVWRDKMFERQNQIQEVING